eukprot:470550-Hanusia_phi.AAC.8
MSDTQSIQSCDALATAYGSIWSQTGNGTPLTTYRSPPTFRGFPNSSNDSITKLSMIPAVPALMADPSAVLVEEQVGEG